MEAQLGILFEVLVTNYQQNPFPLAKNQVIGHLLPHSTGIIETNISYKDVLGITEDSLTQAGCGPRDGPKSDQKGGVEALILVQVNDENTDPLVALKDEHLSQQHRARIWALLLL